MDWYSWLSKSSLERSLVYEYALVFARNELEEEDVAYFDHQFLLSMGISIAKHRLEILKLAKKEIRRGSPRTVARLVAAVKKTKKCLARCARALVHSDSSAIVVVPRAAHADRRRGAMLKRSKKQQLVLLKPAGQLMITDGGASPMVHNEEDDEYWENDAEAIKWDSMFRNLKPT